MEDAPEVQEDLDNGGKFKNWLQDNIRIIFSVLIVVAIAAGIYSYSKRAESPLDQSEVAIEEFMEEDDRDAVTIIGDEGEGEDAERSTETAADETDAVKIDQSQQDSQISISEESDDAFIEAAIRGDSRTTLARKALGNFLEKNNDSSLTAEHKIYIEDYLQKYVGHTGGVYVGTEISFAKTLIRDAIEKSKTLNENQLDNLKKYSSQVPNL
ncbi:MAG: hypothetical protein U9M90_02340 [Patescibacteria group bacterium]|nr:hypothetical protein [Patescibacteria group bacterium]